MKQRLVRADSILDDDESVVRGAELVADAVRSEPSGCAMSTASLGSRSSPLRGTSIGEVAQGSPLVRFATLTTLVADPIRSVGLEIEATGRNPLHSTVLLPDLERAPSCACVAASAASSTTYLTGVTVGAGTQP
jgi:hypothetical protein